MRYSQIINESKKELIREIFTQPYFKFNSLDQPLHRSFDKNQDLRKLSEGVYLLDTPNKRSPTDTSLLIHDILSIYSQKRFNMNIRSDNVFFAYSYNSEKLYQYDGTIYYAIPKNNYNLFYAEGIDDLTYNLNLDHIRSTVPPQGSFPLTQAYIIELKNTLDLNEKQFNILKSRTMLLADTLKSYLSGRIIYYGNMYFEDNNKESIEDLNSFVIENSVKEVFKDIMMKNRLDKLKNEIMHFIDLDKLPSKFFEYINKYAKEDFKNLVKYHLEYYEETCKDYIDSVQSTIKVSDIGEEEIICHCEQYYLIEQDIYTKLLSDFKMSQ